MTLSRPALALAALLAPAAFSSAARAQTLAEALAMAYANNPTLLSARANLRAVDENVPQALAGWRPTVTINSTTSAADVHVRSRTNDLVSTGHFERGIYQNGITITQPVFRGGRTVASTRRAENQVLAQRARLLATEQQVMQDTVTAYVAVIRDQELLRLNINNEQVLSEQLRATNERFRVGEITRTDVAQAESRLAGARSSRSQAEGNLQISRATFQRLVGAVPQRLTAPQPLRQPVTTAQEAAQAAATNNPTVVAALFDEAGARDNINIQISQLLPQISVQGTAQRSDNSLVSTADQLRSTYSQVTANVTVPIYQGGAEYSAVRQARQSAQQARQVVDEQRRTVVQAATQAFEQLQSSKAQVDAVRAQIRAAEIALDGVQREAIVGSRTTLDVLNAEQELLNARTSLVQALSTVVSQSYTLAAAIGRLTALDLGLAVEPYDARAYYNAVRNRWIGLGDYSNVTERR
ncbi:TolC family outer membrane protein [Siccirubricoccus sp. KC 17139]|uniref:TolC family outer membrane protein n=1 Tax=Siccirubricoccus soli TaxID=2899147 RepID=A0ABT1D676_9PROT|nr:TolC family outer membrane protein [Siccirubricoccus soli]MCO6417416.1 TolC family outer membrane protein [Siccirubricoccus soli]MCP2683551.1 TolC family outer membrane protein [Siccirubricoccus soli]